MGLQPSILRNHVKAMRLVQSVHGISIETRVTGSDDTEFRTEEDDSARDSQTNSLHHDPFRSRSKAVPMPPADAIAAIPYLPLRK